MRATVSSTSYSPAPSQPVANYGDYKVSAQVSQAPGNFDATQCDWQSGPSAWSNWWHSDLPNCSVYFAKQYGSLAPGELFNKVRNYQYPAFVKYASSKPGFEEYILNAGRQIHDSQSPLIQKLKQNLLPAECAAVTGALQKVYQDVYRRVDQRMDQALQRRSFDKHGIEVLRESHSRNYFLYACDANQACQLQAIASHLNDLGSFKLGLPAQSPFEVVAIASQDWTFIANQANQQRMYQSSDLMLNVARNFLALGRGAVLSGCRNLGELAKFLALSEDSMRGLGSVMVELGNGIVKAANSGAKMVLLNDYLQISNVDRGWAERQLALEHQKWRRKSAQAGLVYEAVSRAYQNASQEECWEKAGELLVDGLFLAYANPAGAAAWGNKFVKVANVARYEPIVLGKMGRMGQEIHQLVGIASQFGDGYVRRGIQLVENYPALSKAAGSLATKVQTANRWMKKTNQIYRSGLCQGFNNAIQEAMATETRLAIAGGESVSCKSSNLLFKGTGDGEKSLITLIERGPLSSAGSKIISPGLVDHYGNPIFATKSSSYLEFLDKESSVLHFDQFKQIISPEQLSEELCHCFWKYSAIGRNPHCLDPLIPEIVRANKIWADGIKTVQDFTTLGPDQIGAMAHKPFCPDWFHQFHPTPRLDVKGLNGVEHLVAKDLAGFHSNYMGLLEKSGEVTITPVKHGPAGIMVAKIELGGVLKSRRKTLFPSEWGPVEILNKGHEACANKLRWGLDGGKLLIEGEISEGVELKVVIDSEGVMESSHVIEESL